MPTPDTPFDLNDESVDRAIRQALRTDPAPQTPATLESLTRQHVIRRRLRSRLRQRVVVGSVAMACLTILFAWATRDSGEPMARHPGKQDVPLSDLESSELAALFSSPPVDSLSVLDRQQAVSIHVLQQLEERR